MSLPRARGLGRLSPQAQHDHLQPWSPSQERWLRLEEAEIQDMKGQWVGLKLCLGCLGAQSALSSWLLEPRVAMAPAFGRGIQVRELPVSPRCGPFEGNGNPMTQLVTQHDKPEAGAKWVAM